MKLLCIGDLHIQKKNLHIFNEFQTQLLSWLDNNIENIDGIVILGDVLHTMDIINTLCLNTALIFFDKLKIYNIPVYILVGNHDFIGPNEFMSNNHWMNIICKHPNIHVIDSAIIVDDDIIMCPYIPPGRFDEALSSIDVKYNEKKIIFCHQEFKGAQFEFANILSDKGDAWSESNPLIISGHIHKKQWLQKNIYYVGTPYQTRFNEDVDKNIIIIDTKTKNITDVYIKVSKLISIIESIENEIALSTLVFEPENLYKIILESPSLIDTQSFVKKNIYKQIKNFKNVSILFIYPKSKHVLNSNEKYQNDKPLEFKTSLYENIKHNPYMISIYNKLLN